MVQIEIRKSNLSKFTADSNEDVENLMLNIKTLSEFK